MFYAWWFGHEEIVKIILEKDGVDIETKTKDGHTALTAKTEPIKNVEKEAGIAIDTPSGNFEEIRKTMEKMRHFKR